MSVDIFLIKFWGWLLVLSGVIVLSKPALENLLKLSENEAFSVISGYIALLMGLFTVLLTPGCGTARLIVVKILGIIALIKGISLMMFGQKIGKVFRPVFSSILIVRILLILSIIFGAWMLMGVY